jgi:ABC-type transport system substrate-binding protein
MKPVGQSVWNGLRMSLNRGWSLDMRLGMKLGLRQGMSLGLSLGLRLGVGLVAWHMAFGTAFAAADPSKVLRTVFPAAETGFDPAASRDIYSNSVNRSMFDGLFTFDYLARPAKVMPQAADGMPEVLDGGKTWLIRLKKGIYFADDPAFGGKKRELVMADFVYSWKRLYDPKIVSPHSWVLAGRIVGLDQLAAQAAKAGKMDYDAKIEGFELVDKYTLKLHLTRTDYLLPMLLAHNPMVAVAREVIEKYRDAQGQAMGNPVGTGPYKLAQWVRGSRIVLEANPGYRHHVWDFAAGSDAEDANIVAKMKGKTIPQIGRIEISIMLEDQSRLLSFQNGETDLFQLEGPLAPRMLAQGKLKPEMAAKGYQLSRIIDPELTVYYWNMRDPTVGGFSKEKIALRRAIAMAHNVREELHTVWNDQAEALEYPIPPGVVGHDPNYKTILQYDPVAANALLDKFGYKKGKDGFRTLPDGKPLLIKYTARNDSLGQHQSEMWKKTYDSLSIRMEGDKKPFPDILKADKQCKIMTRSSPWVADYPDGDNFMMLFYGKNVKQNNNSCFEHAEYDKLFEASQVLPPGPERDVLFHKMARILEVNAGVRTGYARYRNVVSQPWVIGMKKHPICHFEWLYIDTDKPK